VPVRSCLLKRAKIRLPSFGCEGLGLDAAAGVWLALGYTQRDALVFPAKKLRAFWCVL
jgi:hypothetical protein